MPLPTTVRRASQLLMLFIATGAVAVGLAAAQRQELVNTWAGDASADDTRIPPSFTPVVVVLFVVVATFVLILLSFVRGGHNWARHSLAAVMVLGAVAAVGGIRIGPPVGFVVVGVVVVVIDLVVAALLWHRDTGAYVRAVSGRPVGSEA